MDGELTAADVRFREIVSDAARQIVSGAESPYDVGMRLMGDLQEVLATADFSGGTYAMWGWLTDGIDGPSSYARGLTEEEVERLMRQAAQEWLDLDLSGNNVREYLSRWEDWPESVGSEDMSTQVIAPISDAQQRTLHRLNIGAGVLHALQAMAVLALATSFSLPVTASYLAGPPGSAPQDPTELFSLNTGYVVAAFLLLSALAHALVSTLWWRGYLADLGRGRNNARWVEYAVSSSLMIVLIAQLVGIADVAALIAIFGVNVAMILFGWLQEKYERPGEHGWLPFGFGCIAGAVPWIAIVVYFLAPGSSSSASPPGFVYAIVLSLFVFFNIFALNQWLQYRAKGRWSDYLHGERVYIFLSLTAKSLLAWQVFAGTLAG